MTVVFVCANVLGSWTRSHAKGNVIVAVIALLLSVTRAWAALGVQNVALGLARREPDADAAFRAWVSPGILLQIALVGGFIFAGLVVAALVGLTALRLGPVGYPILLAVGGSAVYGAYAVSQYPMLLLDERADMAESVLLSAELTRGHRATLFVASLIPFGVLGGTIGVFQAAGVSIAGDLPPSFLFGFVPIATVVFVFGTALNASLYLELVAAHEQRQAELSDAAALRG